MKTIDVETNAPSLQSLLQLASEENVILRTTDGKEFLLAEVDDFEHEVALVRQNAELSTFLAERSRPHRTLTLDQVREQLGLGS